MGWIRRPRASSLLPPRPNELHERPERSRHMAAARIIEKRAREAGPPALHDGLQGAALEVRGQPLLEAVDEPGPRDGRSDEEVHRTREVAHEGAAGIDLDD